MNTTVETLYFPAPSVNESEILRYAGCREADGATLALLHECMEESQNRFSYRVCFCELPVRIEGELCDFGSFSLSSYHLSQNLHGCQSALVFGATVGMEIDRLIARYGSLSPAKALMLQAIGAERIEALCDVFCQSAASDRQVSLKPRFSPGYGDLPTAIQPTLFALLDCSKKIGLCLNDSLMMSPSKSVTAFVGIKDANSK
ncbi:MAG: Vitamin B12 dependent methionine synthase activation subunit [Clostridia bacterium]|nr:Vitamin B12 dependent methionine synthase activation subunit [Clostridia bacterium]